MKNETAISAFPLRVPRTFVARMKKGDPNDPLLRQVLPDPAEYRDVKGYHKDPLDERHTHPVPGLLHKYNGRVLLIVTGACAVHCRYCFRRHFPYDKNTPGRAGWKQALDYITRDTSLREVILSGGDPLMVKDDDLKNLVDRIAAIPHVRRLRVHTRMPIVTPARVTQAMIAWLCGTRLKPVVVVHCNHANEIDAGVVAAIRRLREGGATVLNQAVLLRGVNDTCEALAALSEALFAAGVLPYYLHQLDKVAGAAHFAVSTRRARRLLTELRAHLPGYLVPRWVCELPGAAAKIALSPP